jgi:hypothetical protein
MDDDEEYSYSKSHHRAYEYVGAFTFGYISTMLLLATVIIVYLLTHTR